MSRSVIFRPPGSGTTLRVGPGEYLTDKATGEETGGRWTVYEVVSALDSGVPLHEHDWDEAFFVLDGQYRFSYLNDDDGVEHVTAGPGSFVTIPGNAVHAFRNIYPGYSRMLNINQPVGIEPLFRAVGLPCAGPGATPDQEAIPLDEFRAKFGEYGVRVQADRLAENPGPGAWKGMRPPE